MQQQQVDRIASIYANQPTAQQQIQYEQHVRMLESRLQQLTEDNDDLKRELALAN